MENSDLVSSFLGLRNEPAFDFQFTTYLQKYADFRPHNFAIYFFHAFLGFVFTIPQTDLTDKLGIEEIMFKPMSDQTGLKFVFLMKNGLFKKTMVVRNVFFKPYSKNWERGITGSEYKDIKRNLVSRGIDLDQCSRSIAEYLVKDERLYKNENEHVSKKRMSIYLQKLQSDVRMISSEEEATEISGNSFRILNKVINIFDYQPGIKSLENAIQNTKKSMSSRLYNHNIFRIIGELKNVYEKSQEEYDLRYDIWNGADCAFMHGAFLALESRLGLLPVVKHVPAYKILESPPTGLYGRFYLSLIPKRSLVKTDVKLYLKHRPTAMSFVQDIYSTYTTHNALHDMVMLANHASVGNIHNSKLLFQVRFGTILSPGMEMPVDKHLDFLGRCDQLYDFTSQDRPRGSRLRMMNFVAYFFESISSPTSSKCIKDTKYLSRYFLAMLLSVKNREKWNIFAKKDDDKTFFLLESKTEKDKTIAFELIEHSMREHGTSNESPPLAMYDEVVQQGAPYLIIEENFRHTKDDLIDPESTLDLVSRKITLRSKTSTIHREDMVSLDIFDIEQSLLKGQAASQNDLSQLFEKYSGFIEDKHQLSAFVDGLFHSVEHAKDLLPIKPYQSHRQITCFHDRKDGPSPDKIHITHLSFVLATDKDAVAERKVQAIAALEIASEGIEGNLINVLLNKDPLNAGGEDVIHISYSKTPDYACSKRKKRSGACGEMKSLLPIDMESSRSSKKIGSAVENLGKISGYLMTGFMLRDIIADLFRQDTNGAIRDGTFFIGGIFSHKIASMAEVYGAQMLGENKILLGNSLKFAGPILRRLMSAYVLSNLMEDIQRYKDDKNDTTALVNIGVNSAYLTIDAAETGIEVMELFGVEAVEGLSATTGPIGMAIGAALILGSNVYETVKKLEAINKEVPLSTDEEITEILRAFLHLDVSQHIQNEISEQKANEILANQVKLQLESQKRFKYYITASGMIKNGRIHMQDDVIIDLQKTSTFIRSKANPKSCQLFCPLSESLEEHKRIIDSEKSFWQKLGSVFTDIYWTVKFFYDFTRENTESMLLDLAHIDEKYLDHGYVCHNAFGVKSASAQADIAFYQLGTGYNRVHGFSDKPNVYNISDGQNVIYGGFDDDTFILNGNNINGLLDGDGGSNTLDVSRFNLQSTLSMNNIKVVVGNSNFIAVNISKLIGREKAVDIIEVPCSLTMLDLGGGRNVHESDEIFFKNSTCQYNVTLVLSSFTKVYMGGVTSGTFHYIVRQDAVDMHVDISPESKASIIINNPLTEFAGFTLLDGSFSLWSRKSVCLTLYKSIENSKWTFIDGVVVSIRAGHISALLKTDLTIQKILDSYDEFLRRSSMSMVAFSTTDQKSLIFNHDIGEYTIESGTGRAKSLNVIHNDPLHENHIVCSQEQENIILVNRGMTMTIEEFKIPDIHIYCKSSGLILDLSNISQTVCDVYPDKTVTVYGSSEDGEALTITINLISKGQYTVFGKIHIDIDVMDKITIVNYGFSRIIGKTSSSNILSKDEKVGTNYTHRKQTLIIAPDPWRVEENSTLALISECNTEWYQTVYIPREVDNFGIYRINDSALITNLGEKMIYNRRNLVILLLENYFRSDKMKSIRVLDVNKKVLNLNEASTSAESLDDLWSKFISNDNFYHSN